MGHAGGDAASLGRLAGGKACRAQKPLPAYLLHVDWVGHLSANRCSVSPGMSPWPTLHATRFIKNNLLVEVTSDKTLARLFYWALKHHSLISYILYMGGGGEWLGTGGPYRRFQTARLPQPRVLPSANPYTAAAERTWCLFAPTMACAPPCGPTSPCRPAQGLGLGWGRRSGLRDPCCPAGPPRH